MSFNRVQGDRRKVRNFVAKNDFNRGGVHGKSYKAKRNSVNQQLHEVSKLDPYDLDEDTLIELQE